MMIKKQLAYFTTAVWLASGLLASLALAQEQDSQQQIPAAQSIQQVQTAERPEGLGLSSFAIRPQAGAINFNGNSRLSTGVLADFKFFKSDVADLGFEFGGLFSGLNNTINGGSGFSSGVSGTNSTYIVQVPTELQVKLIPGLLGTSKWSFGPTLGVDTIYSSSGIGNSWGTNSGYVTPGLGQGATWNPHFAVGPEVNYAATRVLDIGLREDNVFMSAFTMRTITLGLGFRTS